MDDNGDVDSDDDAAAGVYYHRQPQVVSRTALSFILVGVQDEELLLFQTVSHFQALCCLCY